MATTQFLIEKLVVDSANYTGLGNLRLQNGVASTLNAGGSELDPSIIATTEVVPQFEFDTFDMATWLPALFTSNKIPRLAISSSAQVYLQATSAGGTRGGAGTNIKCNVTKGVFVPRALLFRNGVVGLRIGLFCDWDATNAPVTFSASQNLAAGAAGAPSLWTIRALKIGTTVINRINDLTLDFGIEVGRAAPRNTLYRMDTTLTRQVPRAAWGTHDIAVALAASGASVLASGTGGIQIFLGQYDDDTATVLTTTAMVLTLRAGSCYWPTTLEIDPAAVPLTIRYAAIGQGGDTFATDQPMTLATGQTLPSEGATAAEYRPGRIVLDGAALDYVRASFDFGISGDVEVHGPASLPWANFTTLKRREPTLALQLADAPTFVSTIGLAGVDIGTSMIVYLRKQTAQGEAVADGSGVHISLTASNGKVEPIGIGANHNELVRGDLVAKFLGGLTIATTSTSA